MSSSITSVLMCAVLLVVSTPPAFGERLSSAVAPQAAKSRTAREALQPGVTPAARIELDALPAAQVRAAREKNARGDFAAMQVGTVRDVGSSSASTLRWTALAHARVLQWTVHVEDSHALRVALDVKRAVPGVVARFASTSNPAEVFAQPLSAGLVWSPLLAGGDAIVELSAPLSADVRSIDVSIARIADHFADPSAPDALLKSQWLAAPCEVDLVCEAKSDPVLERAGAASIKLNWIDGYSAFACSGTLVNAADRSFRPYVYTAAHCLDTQDAADTLVSIWFYEKAACGGEDARDSVQLAGGATLLAADATLDATLLRLNRTPPEGAVFAGWDSSAPGLGDALVALHHANGEVTKVSHGTVVDSPPYPRFSLAWTSGIVQGGSSGGGAFSRAGGAQADLLLRGGLSSANASCGAGGYGYYSRLDLAWPMIAPWLSVAPEHANLTGLWWDAAQPGWGVSLNQQGDTAFAVVFTYAQDGRPSWLVASNLARESASAFAGTLYRAAANGVAAVGALRLTLSDANTASLEYTVDGRTVRGTITREAFNGAPAVCVATQASREKSSSFQDLWWDPDDPGWGLGLAQQGDMLFATLFTHDAQGRDTWLVGSNVARQADGAFAGTLYRTSMAGSVVKALAAGSLRIAFADGEQGAATLTVDGQSRSVKLVRQVFGPSTPLCR